MTETETTRIRSSPLRRLHAVDVDRLLTTRLVPFFSGHLARIAKGSYYSTELAVDRPAMRSWQCMISVSAECRNNVATASGCEPSWC
ncbi:hypothetical protein ACLKA6_010513 [Drosophila palustris]